MRTKIILNKFSLHYHQLKKKKKHTDELPVSHVDYF